MPEQTPFADTYRTLSDEHLAEIAQGADSYVPEARSAAEMTLKARGLQINDPNLQARVGEWKSHLAKSPWARLQSAYEWLVAQASELVLGKVGQDQAAANTLLASATWLLIVFLLRLFSYRISEIVYLLSSLLSGQIMNLVVLLPFLLALAGMYLMLEKNKWGWIAAATYVFFLFSYDTWYYFAYWFEIQPYHDSSIFPPYFPNPVFLLQRIGVELTVLIHLNRQHVKELFGLERTWTGSLIFLAWVSYFIFAAIYHA